MENATFFHYKTQTTFLHKIPGWVKILLIFTLSITAFYLPVKICLILYPILILFSAIFLHFSFSEIFSDQKPTLAYIFLLYVATILLNLINSYSEIASVMQNLFQHLHLKILKQHFDYAQCKAQNDILKTLSIIFSPNLTYLPLLAHLALSLEITSIFYRTTSHGQFKDGFSSIEMFVTRKDTAPLSDTLALALSFIPRISTFWNRLTRAWLARGGADSLKKAFILFPKLFHIAMREGYEKSLAIQNRSL